MQAISTQALSSRAPPAGLSARGKRSARQPSRSVVVNAAKGNDVEKQEQKGPNKAVMQAVGAIAAMQLALGGPAFAQDPLPASAESSSARAEVNKETSDAPSLGDIGKNLTQNLFGGGGSDVGQAGKEAADKAANKAKNAAPDLSQGIFDRAQRSIGKISQEAGGAPSQFPDALTNLGKNNSVLGKKASQKASVATSQVSSSAGSAADSAKKGASKAAGKAKNAAPDLSQLPDPGALLDQIQGKASGAADAAQGKASEAQGKAQGAAGQASGQAQGALGAAQGSAQDAAGKAKNAAPDLSQLPDPGALLDQVQGKASGAADAAKGQASQASGKAQGAAGQASGQAQGALGAAQGSAQDAAGKAKNAAPDLSQLPDPGALLNKVQGKASGAADAVKGQASQASGKAQGATGKASGQAQGALGAAQGSAKNAAGKAKNAAPDLSTAELPDGTALFRRLQGKENTWDPLARQAKRAGSQAKNAAPDLSFNPLDLITGEPDKAKQDAKAASKELNSVGGQNFSSGGGPNPGTKEAKDISKDYKAGSKDLPVPNVGDDVETEGIANK